MWVVTADGSARVGLLVQLARNVLLEVRQTVRAVGNGHRVSLGVARTRIAGETSLVVLGHERVPFEHDRIVAVQGRIDVCHRVGKRQLLQLAARLRRERHVDTRRQLQSVLLDIAARLLRSLCRELERERLCAGR